MQLLKFYADWCGPCKEQSRILEDFDSIPVKEIDIEEEGDLANKYNVRSIPTLILEDEGEIVENFVGITDIEEIQESI